MGAWRFLTDCLTGRRRYRWYPRAGLPEMPRVIGPCSKAAALALPLLAGPVGGPAAVAPVPALPWIGQPDRFGAGAYGLPGGFDTTPGFGPADIGWGVFPGLSAGSLTQPASLTADARSDDTAAAWANLAPQQKMEVRPALPFGQQGSNGVATPPLLPSNAAAGVQPVPAPSGLLCLLPACLMLALLRRKVWR